MPYAPRKRHYKVRWKVVVPLLLLVALLIYMLAGLFFPSKKEAVANFTVCGLSEEKTVSTLNKKVADVFTVKDFLYYGESLDLYEKTYSPENEDTLSGKTVELFNVCDGKKISMTMENTVDQKIALDQVTPGFYEVNIIDNLVKKRVVFSDTLKDNAFYTTKRNGVVNKVSIVADKSLLSAYGITWDKNYAYLQVHEQAPRKDDIDVLIDPYGMNMDLTWTADKGNEANGLVENKEMFEAAQLMKKELESYGLRVEITKKSVNEEGKAYGENGRLSIGYKKHAKYYLFLRLNKYGNDTVRGFEVHHSYYSSKTLARTITYGVKKNLNIPLSPMYNSQDEGIVTSTLSKGFDNKMIYDANLHLRESGGRATLAGKYSETSKKENATFANANGMQALEIDFGYISNKADADFWKKNKAKYVKEVARAFAQGINVTK